MSRLAGFSSVLRRRRQDAKTEDEGTCATHGGIKQHRFQRVGAGIALQDDEGSRAQGAADGADEGSVERTMGTPPRQPQPAQQGGEKPDNGAIHDSKIQHADIEHEGQQKAAGRTAEEGIEQGDAQAGIGFA
ncbi:hypothetical protein HMPREF9080_00491 [Cardiobacterium valvarum F0432]|uniref:Uncharacterized protein n=1 Tax=Cardiobacterium valvarum F0432 TaxID=797473 RepID=G9ZCL3_9GAMM|nr:hypothetical protein HMPREF9080_00491 [Cardiobacterium valvarum F0432]